MNTSIPDWWGSLVESNTVICPDWVDRPLPPTVQQDLPVGLRNASIRYGDVHTPRDDVKLNGPPGAGKTTQIAGRVAYLIEVEGVTPSEITIVTFRRSLADEVAARLESWGVIDREFDDLTYWSTIHAVANRACHVLISAGNNLGREDDLGPAVTGREKAKFCSDELNSVNFWPESKTETTRGQLLFKVWEWCADNCLTPSEAENIREAPAWTDLRDEWPGLTAESAAQKYDEWQDYKRSNDWVDFYELLQTAVHSDRTPPTEVVVVDEMHDAFPLFAKVARRWADEANTAIIAGDPKQVVNEYTGASPQFFNEFFGAAPEVLLDTSYRLPETIWQAAKRMLEQELEAPPISRRPERGSIVEHESATFSRPGGTVTPAPSEPGSPAWLIDEYGIEDVEEKSILMLARTRPQVKQLSDALDYAGVIHEMQDMSNNHPEEDGRGGWVGERLEFFNAMMKLQDVPRHYGSGGGEQQSLTGFDGDEVEAGDIELSTDEAAAALKHSTARDLQISADKRDDMAERWQHSDPEEDSVTVRELGERYVSDEWFQKYTGGAASVRKHVIQNGFSKDDMKAVQKAMSRYDSPVSRDQVKDIRVLTIHASKGSEATDVAVWTGVPPRVISEMRHNKSKRENEARTWYVAFSRASERLHLMRGGFHWIEGDYVPENIARVARDRADRVLGNNTGGAGQDGVTSDD